MVRQNTDRLPSELFCERCRSWLGERWRLAFQRSSWLGPAIEHPTRLQCRPQSLPATRSPPELRTSSLRRSFLPRCCSFHVGGREAPQLRKSLACPLLPILDSLRMRRPATTRG